MLSTLFDTAKDFLANAASEQPSATVGKPGPQPSAQPSTQHTESGGADLFNGVLQAVGKALTEGNQPQQQPASQPSSGGTGEQKESLFGNLQLSQDDISMISKGLGAIVNVIQHKNSSDAAQSGPGQNQASATGDSAGKASEGGDFLSGLMNVANELGKALNPQQGNQASNQAASQHQAFPLSAEDIAKITSGLGSLIGTFTQKSPENKVQEEQATKIDSQAVNSQASVTDQAEKKAATSELKPEHAAAAGGDFLGGLMNVAKDLGKALTESQNQSAQGKGGSGGQSQGGSQLSADDIAKITAGLGSLVGTISDKAFKKADAEGEQVSKVDSQGGKVQLSSVHEKSAGNQTDQSTHVSVTAQRPAEQAGASSGSDFFSGLMNVAKDVGKAISENQSGSNQTSKATGGTGGQGSQLSQDDLAKITAGLGSLVGTATEMFKKPSPAEDSNKAGEGTKEKPKEESKQEQAANDIEEEFGKVTLSGYTGHKTAEDATAASKKKEV